MARMTRKVYWGRMFCQTDMGGWVWCKVRPWWFWMVQRVPAFLWFLGRRYEPGGPRFGIRTAWDLSLCAVGLVGPVRVYPMPVDAAALGIADVASVRGRPERSDHE